MSDSIANGSANGAHRLTEEELSLWLEAYGRAWEERDPARAASLFTDDASYRITPSPFGGPLRGRDAIREYWLGATVAKREVSFGYEVLAVADSSGIARWWASVSGESDGRVRLGGVFVVSLTSDCRCRELREWWSGKGDRVDSAEGEAAPA